MDIKLTLCRFWIILLVSISGCKNQSESDSARTSDAGSNRAELFQTMKSYKDRLVAFKLQRSKIKVALDRLGESREKTLMRIRELGIQSAEDMNEKSGWIIHARELEGIVSNRRRLIENQASYDKAIELLESAIRHLDLKAKMSETVISKREFEQILRTVVEIEDDLKIGVENRLLKSLELKDLVEKEMFSDDNSSTSKSD